MAREKHLSIVFLLWSLSFLFSCNQQNRHPSEMAIHLTEHAEITTLDPADANDPYSRRQVAFTYEGLYEFDYRERPLRLIPNLARSEPDISEDRLTYTIPIKRGILFQDDPAFRSIQGKGRELEAADFVYSIKRLGDPERQSSGWFYFVRNIRGIEEWRKKVRKNGRSAFKQPIEGLRAKDRFTLVIELKEPDPFLLYHLAIPYSFVIPHEAVDYYGDSFEENPVGTGPFYLLRKESNLASRLVWARSPSFGYARPSKKIPGEDKVVIHVIQDAQSQWRDFEAGKIDALVVPPEYYKKILSPLKKLTPALEQKGIKLHQVSDLSTVFVGMNTSGVLKKKELRQAMSLAFDSSEFVDTFYRGGAIPALGPIPPGMEGHVEAEDAGFQGFNLNRAKKILESIKHPNGRGIQTLRFIRLSSPTARLMAEFFSKSMRAIGLKIEIEALDWKEFQRRINSNQADLWILAWGADHPGPENFYQLFYGPNRSPGPNTTNFSDPKYDQVYSQLSRVSDQKKRGLYRQLNQILRRQCPWIFVAHQSRLVVSQPWIRNFTPHPFEAGMAKHYRLDPKAKKK